MYSRIHCKPMIVLSLSIIAEDVLPEFEAFPVRQSLHILSVILGFTCLDYARISRVYLLGLTHFNTQCLLVMN